MPSPQDRSSDADQGRSPSTKKPGTATPSRLINLLPPLSPTTSSLASISWYDLARHAGGGALGGMLAALLSVALLTHARSGGFLNRVLYDALQYLLWTIPMTAGLCLSEGHFYRARKHWVRRCGIAVLVVTAGSLVMAALFADYRTQRWIVDAIDLPAVGWLLFGGIIGLGVQLGFPDERRNSFMLISSLLAGFGMGVFSTHFPPARGNLMLHLTTQVSLFLTTGILFAFIPALVRELNKIEWLQILHGDQSGRHYHPTAPTFTIGSAPDNTLVLPPSSLVHPHHARIRLDKNQTFLETVDPSAVLFLHDRQIDVCELYDGDEFQIGETMIRYYRIT